MLLTGADGRASFLVGAGFLLELEALEAVACEVRLGMSCNEYCFWEDKWLEYFGCMLLDVSVCFLVDLAATVLTTGGELL